MAGRGSFPKPFPLPSCHVDALLPEAALALLPMSHLNTRRVSSAPSSSLCSVPRGSPHQQRLHTQDDGVSSHSWPPSAPECLPGSHLPCGPLTDLALQMTHQHQTSAPDWGSSPHALPQTPASPPGHRAQSVARAAGLRIRPSRLRSWSQHRSAV